MLEPVFKPPLLGSLYPTYHSELSESTKFGRTKTLLTFRVRMDLPASMPKMFY